MQPEGFAAPFNPQAFMDIFANVANDQHGIGLAYTVTECDKSESA